MNSVGYLPQSKRLLDQVREVLRYKHYSLKTEQAYLYWIRFLCDGMESFFTRQLSHDQRLGICIGSMSGPPGCRIKPGMTNSGCPG